MCCIDWPLYAAKRAAALITPGRDTFSEQPQGRLDFNEAYLMTSELDDDCLGTALSI
jgi:hypothetical protein